MCIYETIKNLIVIVIEMLLKCYSSVNQSVIEMFQHFLIYKLKWHQSKNNKITNINTEYSLSILSIINNKQTLFTFNIFLFVVCHLLTYWPTYEDTKKYLSSHESFL